MKTKLMITMMALLAGSQAWARGNELGNGGDVFYCPKAPGGPRAEMVDVYEASRAGRVLDFGPAGLNYRDKVKYVLAKWSKTSPLRMQRYSEWFESFDSESRFSSGETLPNIPDEGVVAIPKGCEIQQVAIQLADGDLGTFYKRYTVDKDLWDLMDEDNRAAMILHELVFREAILAENRESMRVRHLNGVLLSNSTVQEYFDTSANLNGLFLEWGWAGFERPVNYYNQAWAGSTYSEKEVKLKQPNELRFVQFWGRSDGVSGRLLRDGNYLCPAPDRFVFDDGSYLVRNLGGSCLFEGRIRIQPNENNWVPPRFWQNWMEIFLVGQKAAVSIEGTFPLVEGKQQLLKGVQAQSVRVRNFAYQSEDSRAKVEAVWECSGLSEVGINDSSRELILNSESGKGACTLTLDRERSGERWSTSWSDFHELRMAPFIKGGTEWRRAEVTRNDGKVYLDFQLGAASAHCLKEADDAYQCSGIPSQLKCQIPVLDAGGATTGTNEETIEIKDTAHLRSIEGQGAIRLLLPKGQTVNYRRNSWRSAQPEKLGEDAWVGFSWDRAGKCQLSQSPK